MTEPPIVAPPNWAPTPPARETDHARIVRLFKEDVWNAKEIIRFWAGRSDKTQNVRNSATATVRVIFGKIPKLQSMHRLDDGTVAELNAFGAVWQDGNGSWTQSKPLIAALNDRLMDLEP
jgi:hypothetical protein